MPLFELDESGSRLVRPMQPAAASFEPDSAELVTTHLSELLGEGLFPVATRRSAEDERPHMLALDVVGQPVVVEVVAELDSASLIQALAYAGQAGRLTSGDLARLYHDGAEQFGVDLMAFRESLPAAYSRRGLRVGARLLLVCSTVNPEIADALEFLRAPGRQVEVLQMGVIHGAGGRRYLDVSPLAGPIAELRQVEQANLRLVRSDEAFAAAMAYDEQRKAFSRFAAAPDHASESVESPFAATGTDGREISAGTPATGPTPAAPAEHFQMPISPAHASPVSPTARFSPVADRTPAVSPPTADTSITPPSPARPVVQVPPSAPPAAAATPVPTAPPAPAPAHSGHGSVVDGEYVPTFVPSPPLISPDARALTDEPEHAAPVAPQAAAPVAPPSANAPAPAAPAPAAPATYSPLPPPMALPTSSYALGHHGVDSTAEDAVPVAASRQQPNPRLTALVGQSGPVELVWFRERRGQRLTAQLRADGLIELPSGEVFGDPSAAAQIASRAALHVDGWGVWRVGNEDGPTLHQCTTH
ncbi:MAG: hypothetical protein GX593_02340 [Actinomycetales bacterium]|nr:hypothetical protein [Actinomycetales bacterium]